MITAAVQRHEAAGALIFDVGAGNGCVAAALQRAGFPTVAIEPNRSGAANAVKRGLESVVCGHLPSPAFRQGTADAIGLFDVVEHIETDQAYLESLRPYLKPGGRMYVTVPAYQWLWSDNDVIGGHYRRHTLPRLRRVMERAGYRVGYQTYFFVAFRFRSFSCGRCRRAAGDLRWNRSPAHHGVISPWARRLAQRALALETRLTVRGKSIPFGASCLIVADQAAIALGGAYVPAAVERDQERAISD